MSDADQGGLLGGEYPPGPPEPSAPPKGKGGLPDVSTHTLNDPPGTVYQGPGGLTFYFDGYALKPLSTSSTTDKYINLGNGNLFDTTTGQTVNTGTGGGGGAGAASASISANASMQNEQTRAANALEIAKLQNAVTTARDEGSREAAKAALAQKYAEMSGRMPDGSPTLAARGQEFNEFMSLSDKASNPRNFMQTFFLHRGQNPPADSGGYGNGPSGLGAQHAPPSTAPGGYAMPGFAQQPTPTMSQPQTGMVRTGGTPQGVDPGYDNAEEMGRTVYANSPENSERITNAVGAGQLPKTALGSVQPFARGGVTPEPIMGVGMHSNPEMFQAMQQVPGHKYLIGEHGPEGVVPAEYLPKFLQSRQGQQALPGASVPTAYADGGMIGAPQGASGGDMTAMFGMGGPLGLPTRPMQAAMRSPLMGSTMDGGAAGMGSDITAFAAGGTIGYDPGYDNADEAGRTMYAGTPQPSQQPAPTYSLAAPSSGNPAATAPPQGGLLSGPNAGLGPPPKPSVPTEIPGGTPGVYGQGAPGQNFGPPPPPSGGTAGASPALGNPYTHTHTYSGNVSPYDQLSQAGAIPPWLSRVNGQAQGDQSVGTNTPQMAYLPPGVPLVSQLAYSQMDPSEQQALVSYVSSYGVDPADYIAQVHGQMSAARKRQSIHYVGQ